MDSNERDQQPTELELEEQRAGYDADGPDDLFQRLQQSSYAAPIRPFHVNDTPDEPDADAQQAPETDRDTG